MRDLAQLLNSMRESGVIAKYALFGATAQMRYTEPVATLDVDVLVSLPDAEGLDILRPIYDYCVARGYEAEGEAIRVGAWPVQFIPVFSSLTREALDQAETADFEEVPLQVVGAAHLAAIALSVGRGKDYARILSLLESKATTVDEIHEIALRHELDASWTRFARRFLDE
ncbi:MAG: hypothetical protein M3P06_20150 [Acidobacteriota bacterium]|nr:hypothetical protein [Acidobacteriota bacterium]